MTILKSFSAIFIFLISMSQAFGASNLDSCQHEPSAFKCVKVLRNYDGDTLTVDIPNTHPLFGKAVSVRIAGIDTPEVKTKDQCEKVAGRAARNLVESLLKNAQRVDLLNVQRDKYFRVLADVTVDGVFIKDILLKNKLAYSYDGGTKKQVNWCSLSRQPAQTKAQK